MVAGLSVEGAEARGELDLRVYRLVAIQKAAYRLADQFTLVLGGMTDTTVAVALVFPAGTKAVTIDASVTRFFEELLDQELREKIGAETRAVRDLILAHAFSRTNLVR